MLTASWVFFSFTSNDYNATESNLKLSHLNCLNYAGKGMVSSGQPYSEGQNAFTRHHQSLRELQNIFGSLSSGAVTRYTQAAGVL